MYGAQHCGNVADLMQAFPSLWCQFFDRAVVGGEGNRDQDDKGEHTDGDVGAFDNIGPDLAGYLYIEDKPDEQMTDDEVKGEQSEGASELNEVHTCEPGEGA